MSNDEINSMLDEVDRLDAAGIERPVDVLLFFPRRARPSKALQRLVGTQAMKEKTK